jgi:hypothetical protein
VWDGCCSRVQHAQRRMQGAHGRGFCVIVAPRWKAVWCEDQNAQNRARRRRALLCFVSFSVASTSPFFGCLSCMHRWGVACVLCSLVGYRSVRPPALLAPEPVDVSAALTDAMAVCECVMYSYVSRPGKCPTSDANGPVQCIILQEWGERIPREVHACCWLLLVGWLEMHPSPQYFPHKAHHWNREGQISGNSGNNKSRSGQTHWPLTFHWLSNKNCGPIEAAMAMIVI